MWGNRNCGLSAVSWRELSSICSRSKAGPPVRSEHWRREVLAFLLDARRSWAPSMHGRIDLFQLYEDAWAATSASTLEGEPPNALPPRCPFGIEHLIVERPRIPDLDFLLAMLR